MTAPEVALLADKYANMKLTKDGTRNKPPLIRHAESLSNAQPFPLDDNIINKDNDSSEFELQELTDAETNEGLLDPNEPLNPCESLDDVLPKDSLSQKTGLSTKNQATLLLSFAKSETTDSETDASLKQVMDAVADLSLKVDSIGKQHTTFLQLAFEDNNVRKSVPAMRKAENILVLTESSQLLEWFYDETTECAVLRCLPCFQLHVAAKPTIAKLTALKAQSLLNTKSSGTLSTGIFIKKETTRLLIKGHNQTWYREKNFCIEHVCLIGVESVTHKKAMVEYNKGLQANQRMTTASGNIFRAAIVDLKLGAAGRQFENLISFLACCAVNVGSIGHCRDNFNHIIYCLEKTVDNRINAWLNTPLPSTLLPPHFWATVDKATPSRTTNREKSGLPCPIP